MAEALAEWAASAHCVNYVVGCDGVGGVVGSAGDVLRHLAARQPASCPAWLLETGSVRGKKNNRDIGLYRLISVFESGRVSVVGLADNPPPELTEVGH